jgi:Tfp pilus assembly protein PilV
MNSRLSSWAGQRGTSLIEALIAFLVLSLGMLAAASLQMHLRLNAELTRQRAETVRLGQEDMEQLRAYAAVTAAPGVPSYEAIASATTEAGGDASGTRFTVARQVDPAALAHARTASVTVSWADRAGSAQNVVLHSMVAEANPAYSGALAIPPSGSPVRGAYGRSVGIPLAARDLGDGRSVLKPIEGGTAALVFDNRAGLVIGRCTGIDPATTTGALTPAALAGCDGSVGTLLSGVVRFSTDAAPNPAAANAAALTLSLDLALSGGSYASAPHCDSEAKKTVSYTGAAGLRIEAVPLAATPAWLGLATWADTGERHVAYHCVVYPLASGQWSGRATIVPSGWSIGNGSSDWHVCRYSADLDTSGAIDSNLEHPSSYTGVDSALANQNFLVVKGGSPCPGASPVHLGPGTGDVFADLSTLLHQP